MTNSAVLPVPAALENDLYTQFHCMIIDHLKKGKNVLLKVLDKDSGEFVRWIRPDDSIKELLDNEFSKENWNNYIILFILGEHEQNSVEVATNTQRWVSIVLQIGFNCSIQYEDGNSTNPFALQSKIVSLMPQHKVTPEQEEAGIIQTPESIAQRVLELSTFTADENGNPPTMAFVRDNAEELAMIAGNYTKPINISENFYLTGYVNDVMIGGAPFFMPKLENELLNYGRIGIHYAFSERVVVEQTMDDGTVRKTAQFKYLGNITE